MQILNEQINPVQPPAKTDYNRDNPIWGVVHTIEDFEFSASYEHYHADAREFLFPFHDLVLRGPQGDQFDVLDPAFQDNKNDFEKQNIRGYKLRGTYISRGYATAGNWSGPYLHLSYDPKSDSPLVGPNGVAPGPSIKLYLKVNNIEPGRLIDVPYNETSDRYEIEIWGFPGADLRPLLDSKGQGAIDRGELIVDTNIVRGNHSDFFGPQFDAQREAAIRAGQSLTPWDIAKDHLIHPIRPCHIELAWANASTSTWDSNNGANWHYEFNMPFRGWNNYLGIGVSANPHGGVGYLEFRNLFSNYFDHEAKRQAELGAGTPTELGRDLDSWNYDADWLDRPASQRKPPDDPRKPNPRRESFMAVDYMDLHILKPNCGIGIHRHRDNQEVFMMMQGKGMMVVGDWCKFPGRERAFEVRTMVAGDLTLCKTGRLHALLNSLDEDVSLFMFGGYD